MDKARTSTMRGPDESPAAGASPTEPATGAGDDQTAFARQVLDAESRAIEAIPVDQAFHEAVEMILGCHGTVVVSGLGKNGPIAQKLAATFASTGTPAHFLHPTEAVHGDLGRIRQNDLVLLLSRSGNTEEIVTLAALLKQDKVNVIGIAARRQCDLGRLAKLTLCIGEMPEACPLQLAPTASTTAMLALGDALALTVSRRRNFGVEQFRKFHPGGSLGRELMPVTQVLRLRAGVNLPLCDAAMTVEQAFAQSEAHAPDGRRPGALVVAEPSGRLAGIFTDGDLRRLLIRHGAAALARPLGEVMTARPRHLTEQSLVRDAVQMAREYRIDEMPVVDAQGTIIGLLDVQDLMALKVIE